MSIFSSWGSHPWTQLLGWTLIHFLWQGVLAMIVLAAVLSCLRRSSAKDRYLAALTTLLFAALMPIATFLWMNSQREDAPIAAREESISEPTKQEVSSSEPKKAIENEVRSLLSENAERDKAEVQDMNPAAVDNQSRKLSDEESQPENTESVQAFSFSAWLQPRLPWVVAVWLVGVFVISMRLVLTWLKVQRLKCRDIQPVPEPLSARLQPLCDRLGIQRKVGLFASPFVVVPTVVGWLKPVVLFPVSACSGLTPAQLESLLSHELAHIKRYDYAVNLVQVVCETLFFYHPAVWWISRQIRREREHCCDDIAAAVTGDEAEYVRALLQMAETHLQIPRSPLALAASDGELLGRARRLLRRQEADCFAPGAGGVVLGAMLIVVSVGFLQAARSDSVPKEADIEAHTNGEEASIGFANLTLEKVYKEVESSMERYSKVRYSAEFEETRNANAFRSGEILPVEGKGKWLFVTDGEHWRAERDGFTHNLGEAEAIPIRKVAGFDGERFYEWERGRFVIGVDSSLNEELAPRTVFWRGARTVDWFLAALKSWNARIDREVTVGGRKCIVIVSQPGQPRPDEAKPDSPKRTLWDYEITLSPTQSWLPVKTVIHMDGESYSDETQELTRSADGLWYPKLKTRKQLFQPDPLISRTTRVTALESPSEFAEKAFYQSPPLGQDIVDRALGETWHNDPWWAEMKPWLRTNVDWPRPSLRVLNDMKSYVNEGIEGEPAPEIAARKWLGEKPAAWPRPNGRIRVLAFIGGRAIDPTPEWIAALRELKRRYGSRGLEVVAIATATGDRELIEQAYRVVQPGFPWAIDQENDGEGNRFGKTFAAYKLQHYAGVLLVDSAGRVNTLESVRRSQDSKLSPLEFAIREALDLKTDIEPDSGWLSDREIKQIDAEWKRRRNGKDGQGTITGRVAINAAGRDKFGDVPLNKKETDVTVRLRAVPMMQMLHSDTTGGWHVFMDYRHAIEEEFAAKEPLNINGLRKGSYRMTIRPDGFAAREIEVSLLSDDDDAEFDLEFHQADTINGIVLATNGQPIPGVQIKGVKRFLNPDLLKRYTTAQLPNTVTTDAKGRFEIKGLFVGAFELDVSAKGFQKQIVSPVPAGKEGLKIVLQEPGEKGITKTNANAPQVIPCRIVDRDTGQPIPEVSVFWRLNHRETHQPIWEERFVTDADGKYTPKIPEDAVKNAGSTISINIEHVDYLPHRGVGWPIRRGEANELTLADYHQTLKMQRGRVVTGQFTEPDGSPAKDLTVMIGDNRDGFQDGIGIGYYAKTDADGRFRLVTKKRWPQRISWFPKNYAANSKAVTREFGDQGTIRLKKGHYLKGKLVSAEGNPMPGVFVRATSGTRIPRLYAKTDANGQFAFDPLPAERYSLRAVRNFQDHHTEGEWHAVKLPVPIPAQFHKLKEKSEPALIRAPSTIRIRVRVVDGAGKPLPNERLAIGQTGDYRNAILSEPVPNQPGDYEFIFPEGQYIRDVVLRHSWDEVAYYQEAPGKPFLPGTMLVLGKAEEDISGITVQLRQAGKIRLRLKTDTGKPIPKPLNISTHYLNKHPESSVRFGTGIVHTGSPEMPNETEIKPIAADEPFEITIKAPGYQPWSKTVELGDGQAEILDVTLSQEDE